MYDLFESDKGRMLANRPRLSPQVGNGSTASIGTAPSLSSSAARSSTCSISGAHKY